MIQRLFPFSLSLVIYSLGIFSGTKLTTAGASKDLGLTANIPEEKENER